jgi:bacterioferritin-associated ferredoxin
MIVCVCRRISDREIARHARAGLGFDEIQFELGVATQCGQCETSARDVVAQCNASCLTAHIKRAIQPLKGISWETSPPFTPLSLQHSPSA